MVHLDPPRGTRALYERFADFIGLKVILLRAVLYFISQQDTAAHSLRIAR